MRICFYYNAPYRFDDRSYKIGVGGSEAAFILLIRALTRLGHEVEVFARPPSRNSVYRELDQFDSSARYDAIVVMRYDGVVLGRATAPVKVLWTTHEELRNDDVRCADRVVVASPFQQAQLMGQGVPPDKVVIIPYGVDAAEYRTTMTKQPGKLIYCSIPDRGLLHLPDVFRRIASETPRAELHITSDWRLWGRAASGDEAYRTAWAGVGSVKYHGRLERRQLVAHQKTADLMVYPCTWPEYFCIAALECAAAGAVPVVTSSGALPTTVADAGVVVPLSASDWRERMAREAIALLHDTPRHEELRRAGRRRALEEFNWSAIAARFWVPLLQGNC